MKKKVRIGMMLVAIIILGTSCEKELEAKYSEQTKQHMRNEYIFHVIEFDDIYKWLNETSYDHLRIKDYEQKRVLFLGQNIEGIVIPGPVLIQEQERNQFWISKKAIWDLEYDNTSGRIFAGVRYSNSELDQLGKHLGIDSRQMVPNSGLNGDPTHTILFEISLASIFQKSIGIGGEELSIENEALIFTNYGAVGLNKLLECFFSVEVGQTCRKTEVPTKVVTLEAPDFLYSEHLSFFGQVSSKDWQYYREPSEVLIHLSH